MRRIFIVYNPKSSHHSFVKKEVLEPARKLKGCMICKYEVRPTDIIDNAKALSELLRDDDLLISAGGDGTANIALNAIILSGRNVIFSTLGYGNFNDFPTSLGKLSFDQIVDPGAKYQDFYPLKAELNGKLWRYAGCYITIGLLAASTKIFDQPEIRKKLHRLKPPLIFSLKTLAFWYLKNHKSHLFLPKFSLNNKPVPNSPTDYLALNTCSVGRIMRGPALQAEQNTFLSTTENLKPLSRLISFMLHAMTKGISGHFSTSDTLTFKKPASIEIQAEGESERLDNITEVKIEKLRKPIRVII